MVYVVDNIPQGVYNRIYENSKRENDTQVQDNRRPVQGFAKND
jgi:hypothetical protein